MSSFSAYYAALSALWTLRNESGKYTQGKKALHYEYADHFWCYFMGYLGYVAIIRHIRADNGGVPLRIVTVYTSVARGGRRLDRGFAGCSSKAGASSKGYELQAAYDFPT